MQKIFIERMKKYKVVLSPKFNDNVSLFRIKIMYETGILQHGDTVSLQIDSIVMRTKKDYKVLKQTANEMKVEKWRVLNILDVKSFFKVLGCSHIVAVVILIVEFRQEIYTIVFNVMVSVMVC